MVIQERERPYAVTRAAKHLTYVLTRECSCTKMTTVTVDAQQLWDYEHTDKAIQDAFPHLTPQEREAVFRSGICLRCWSHLMGDLP